MASDFLHTGQLVNAVIAVLKGGDGAAHTGGLPANWFVSDGKQIPLKLLEHGDLLDYPTTPERLLADLPAILVRGRGLRPYATQGVGPVQRTEEFLRVVHVRKFDQCFDDNGAKFASMTLAREYYAKTLGKALFRDKKGMLAVIDADGTRHNPTLTCADPSGAQINGVEWLSWDLGMASEEGATEDVTAIRDLRAPLWAIACDLKVLVTSGG
jgi:hypothetical protein